MRTESERRPSSARPSEYGTEDELDFGRFGRAIVERWWLPVVGLLIGVVLGYLIALGGKDVWQAQATIYLGQPLSPTGSTPLQSLSTNPSAVRDVVLAASVQHDAEQKAGMRTGALAGHISIQAIAGAAPALGRPGQNPLVSIVVTGSQPASIAAAADALAQSATQRVSGTYVTTKIAALKRQLVTDRTELLDINRRVNSLQAAVQSGSGMTTVERLLLANSIGLAIQEQRQVVADQAQNEQLLTIAQNVEQSKVLTSARATKTTARSRRNSVIVAGFIGLILGLIAALLWEPLARVVGRARP